MQTSLYFKTQIETVEKEFDGNLPFLLKLSLSNIFNETVLGENGYKMDFPVWNFLLGVSVNGLLIGWKGKQKSVRGECRAVSIVASRMFC